MRTVVWLEFPQAGCLGAPQMAAGSCATLSEQFSRHRDSCWLPLTNRTAWQALAPSQRWCGPLHEPNAGFVRWVGCLKCKYKTGPPAYLLLAQSILLSTSHCV